MSLFGPTIPYAGVEPLCTKYVPPIRNMKPTETLDQMQSDWPGICCAGKAKLFKVTACKVLCVGRGPFAITQEDIDEEIRNAQRVKLFDNPNIVSVLSVLSDVLWHMLGDWRTASFIQMELCQTDLQSFIQEITRERETMSLRQFYAIAI